MKTASSRVLNYTAMFVSGYLGFEIMWECVRPFCTERGNGEGIGKVLCFARNLIAAELDDAYGVERLAVNNMGHADIRRDPCCPAQSHDYWNRGIFSGLAPSRSVCLEYTARKLRKYPLTL
jgi:hypothetical protein